MACELGGGGDGRSVDFDESLASLKVMVKNVVFGTYPPDVDLGWVEV